AYQPSPVPSALGIAMFGACLRLCSMSERSGSYSSSLGAIGPPRYATHRHIRLSSQHLVSAWHGRARRLRVLVINCRLASSLADHFVYECQLEDHRRRDVERVQRILTHGGVYPLE